MSIYISEQQEELAKLYEELWFDESTAGRMLMIFTLTITFPLQILGWILNTFFDAKLKTGGEKRMEKIHALKKEMGREWFSYAQWKLKEKKDVSNKIKNEKNWLSNLWARTVKIATMYTGTFIMVMFLNQLLFFGLCLNPVCLIAAMPHVLLITAFIGSWVNKEANWGKKSFPETATQNDTMSTRDSFRAENVTHAVVDKI